MGDDKLFYGCGGDYGFGYVQDAQWLNKFGTSLALWFINANSKLKAQYDVQRAKDLKSDPNVPPDHTLDRFLYTLKFAGIDAGADAAIFLGVAPSAAITESVAFSVAAAALGPFTLGIGFVAVAIVAIFAWLFYKPPKPHHAGFCVCSART